MAHPKFNLAWLPAILVGLGVAIPLLYLAIRALGAEPAQVLALLWRARNAELLANTLLLATGVVAVATLIALPLAWLEQRTDLPGRRALTLLGIAPLAIPAYLMAYALLGLGGRAGLADSVLGFPLPRAAGYWGSLWALSLYTFPYLFLNFRASLAGMDPAPAEAARTLGAGPGRVWLRVSLPALGPAFLAGALLIYLHVLGDFGVVSLMRYETLSQAIYVQYSSAFDRVYAAWLAFLLLLLAGLALALEAYLAARWYQAAKSRSLRPLTPVRLGFWRWPLAFLVALLAVFGVGMPFWVVGYWAGGTWSGVGQAWQNSLMAAAPAAALAVMLGLPLARLAVRQKSRLSYLFERLAYLGYAVPPLALALGLVFTSLALAPAIYQTLALLIWAYTIHFLAEGLGPLRASWLALPGSLEEAARALGSSAARTFLRINLPLLGPGILASFTVVFLSALKELPLTFILAPFDFPTLATRIFSFTEEGLFAQAAPYALCLLGVGLGLAGFLRLMLEKD